MSSVDIQVVGMKDLLAALDKMEPKPGNKLLAKATAEGTKKVLKPKLKAAVPWPSMKRAVRAGAAKKDKPAGIVKFDNKRAWFRHFLIGGTKEHQIRFHDEKVRGVPKTQGHIHHPGIKARPVISEVADQSGNQALDVSERYLIHTLGLDD
jgi:hypothetical protein